MALNPELLALLACPVCRGELDPVDNESGLECPACGLVFPVRDKKRPSARMTGSADSARNNPAETRKACPPGHAFPL